MSSVRIALVGPPEHPEAAHARRALDAVLPEAEVISLPVGADPTLDLDGLWLLPPPVGADPLVHDTSTARALELDLPLLGSVAGTGEGGTPLVRAVPGSRLAGIVGEHPVELPQAAAGGRPARDYVDAPGTVWFPEAHRGATPATVTAAGTPFVTLSDYPLATEAGVHPLLVAFAAAVREHAGARTPAPALSHPAPTRPIEPRPREEPRSYVHQMRTATYRWWRPFLALALAIGVSLVLLIVLSIVWIILDPTMREPSLSVADLDLTAPVPMLIGNLMLAALIPAGLVATRLGHWRPMGRLWSVTGRIRWRWLGRATLVTLVLWGGFIALSWALGGQPPGQVPDHQVWLLVIILLTTPLQSAGEEVAFRGGLLQGVGAWIPRPVPAFVVGTAASATLFALAHGSFDPWILLELAAMALAACYLTWRTGGLEAAIVLHAVNNVVLMVLLTVFGGLSGAFINEGSTGTALSSGIGVLAIVVMTLVLIDQARRAGIAPKRIGAPALSPGSRHLSPGSRYLSPGSR